LFKTDHQDYSQWAAEEIATSGRFELLDWSDDAFFYPQTDFEEEWRAQGREVYRLRAAKPED
ncbi:MAG: tRNA (guanosine(46)-N7)-methyltransferase TrmB, partial [Roseibacillus sp.]